MSKFEKIIRTIVIISIAITTMILILTVGTESILKSKTKTYDVSNVYGQYQQTKEINNRDELARKLNDLGISYTVTKDEIKTDYISYKIEASNVYAQESNIVKEIEMLSGKRILEDEYKISVKNDKSILEKINSGKTESLLIFENGTYTYIYVGDIDVIEITLSYIMLFLILVILSIVRIIKIWK